MGALPPDVLGDLSDERGREDGFIHRILFAFPTPIPGKWVEDELSPATLAGLERTFANLWELQPAVDEQGNSCPQVVTFTPEGKAAWVEWVTAHYQEQEEESFPANLKGPWSKLEGYCARLALILQLCRYAAEELQTEQVDATSVLEAGALIHYFKNHTRRVYATLRTTPEDKRVLAVVDWIKKHGKKATARDLLRHNVAGIKKATEAHGLLRQLVDRGYGTLAPEGKKEVFILAD